MSYNHSVSIAYAAINSQALLCLALWLTGSFTQFLELLQAIPTITTTPI